MIRVEVTKEDIESGIKANCIHCPVAKGLQRALACGEIKVGVNGFDFLGKNGWNFGIELPVFVSLKIQLFDATGEMEPFGFDLDL